ncbi:MAG: malto-oligosyltrehalose synthase [Myxococcota bacterium]|nr:malto-oligosyltrehalose synthase [Myxococcota bacterium]
MRIPISTYRLQLRAGVDLRRAAELLGYLQDLGITDLYLAPILESEPESDHGYDVVAHDRVDPRIGGDEALGELARAARERGMGVIVDFVPNHMSVASERNAHWQELLTHGRAAAAASIFDVQWSPPRVGLEGRLLLPILGDMYGRVLEKGELALARRGGSVRLRYWERDLPLAPATIAPIAQRACDALAPHDPRRDVLGGIAHGLAELPAPQALPVPDASMIERARDLEARLVSLIESEPDVAAAFDSAIAEWNGTPGDPASFDALNEIIGRQAYRPSAWRLALESINYRRFFDVDHLAAIRMEQPHVFEAAHRATLAWIGRGWVTGIRLDHVDGLADPEAYFETLQDAAARALGVERAPGQLVLWTIAEKILERGERLPPGWALSGTTGYEAARLFTGVLVDPRATPKLSAFYRRFTGDARTFEEHAYECKRLVLRTTFASEVRALTDELERLAVADRHWCDLTPSALTVALEETIAAFPVYRSYVRSDGSRARDDDALLLRSLRRARQRSPERVSDAFDFLQAILLAKDLAPGDPRAHAVMRFQQLTGPATAKAIEDTAFYRFARFVAANEVGGEPSAIHVDVAELHRANAERAERWPSSMLTTSTHDTKRGEDARARLAVLSERADAWRHAVSRWSRRGRAKRTTLEDGEKAPSARDEYLIYQTLVGVWPFAQGAEAREGLADRVVAYVEKALREAKEHTSWIRPRAEYEGAAQRFVRRMLEDSVFTDDLDAFCAELGSAAISNSLAQVLLRTVSPGVPDLYQGSEEWNQSLVDPDNRRPVDFDRLRASLAELRSATDRAALARSLLSAPGDGRIKLWVTHRALEARRRAGELHLRGAYEPLEGGEHCIAFARTAEDAAQVAIVTRLPFTLAGERAPIGEAWGELRIRGAALADGTRWRDELTDRVHVAADGLSLAEVLAVLPCALLTRLSASA